MVELQSKVDAAANGLQQIVIYTEVRHGSDRESLGASHSFGERHHGTSVPTYVLIPCRDVLTQNSFPNPKIFTNALLQSHDITALIRDTEAHERALFSVNYEEIKLGHRAVRKGALPRSHSEPVLNPQTSVGRMLGREFLRRMRQDRPRVTQGRSEVDVELLLQGAERICAS